jgi:hypothetical protein
MAWVAVGIGSFPVRGEIRAKAGLFLRDRGGNADTVETLPREGDTA